MTLEELEIILEEKLNVEQLGLDSFIAIFRNMEVMRGSVLASACWFGKTELEAKQLLCKMIQGEKIVLGSLLPGRKEFQMPPKITC